MRFARAVSADRVRVAHAHGFVESARVYEEALIEVKRLILHEEITEYARDLVRIEEANLFVLLGQCADAEQIIRDGRAMFRSFYTYYGVRAAW